MRALGVEFLFDLSPVARGKLTLSRPSSLDVDADGRLFIIDYPDLTNAEAYYSPGRNRSRIVTFHPETGRRADIDMPDVEDFQADLIRITAGGDLLLVRYGQWPEGTVNGVVMSPGGHIRQLFRFGECVADVAVDDAGRIFVLYNEEGFFGALRKGQPLIELYGPDGGRIEGDPQLTRILTHLHEWYDGSRIHVFPDGGVLVNGTHYFDVHGDLVSALWSGSMWNITVVDEYDNIFFIPPRGGGLFLLVPGHGGFAEAAMETSRPVAYDEYAWHHAARGGHLYLLNKRIPKVEVFRIRYS